MTKSHFTVTLFILLILFMENGFCQSGEEWPVDDNNYIYLASNVLNLKHIASFGIWNPQHKFGLNATLSYYPDITVARWIRSGDTPEYSESGPSFVSLSTTIRFKPDADLNTFSGVGISVNKLIHGKYPEVDNAFEWSTFMACPRSKYIQYDLPYSTFLIENGYIISSKGRPFFVGFIVAWHPIVTEFWRRDNRLVAKGYYTPLNLQARIEFGLKVNVKDR